MNLPWIQKEKEAYAALQRFINVIASENADYTLAVK